MIRGSVTRQQSRITRPFKRESGSVPSPFSRLSGKEGGSGARLTAKLCPLIGSVLGPDWFVVLHVECSTQERLQAYPHCVPDDDAWIAGEEGPKCVIATQLLKRKGFLLPRRLIYISFWKKTDISEQYQSWNGHWHWTQRPFWTRLWIVIWYPSIS